MRGSGYSADSPQDRVREQTAASTSAATTLQTACTLYPEVFENEWPMGNRVVMGVAGLE